MKKHVGIITADTVLYNKIRLLLRDVASVTLANIDESAESFDLCLCDARLSGEKEGSLVIGEGGAIPLCFRHEDLLSLLEDGKEPDGALTLLASTHEAFLFGEAIKLTEVEYKLLEVICSANGFVSKEAILDKVWGEGYDLGVVNVYVHYLRRKLERDGRKVIISSRNEGYKISENYRRRG